MIAADLAPVFETYFSGQQAVLLQGMVLGVDLDRNTDFYTSLKTAGFLHIVVLSGSNVSLVTSIVCLLLFPLFGRKIGTGFTLCTLVWFVFL